MSTPAPGGGEALSETMRIINPASGRDIAEIASTSPGRVDELIVAARTAFRQWSAVTPAERAGLLRLIAERVDARREELALLETRNVGKPLADSRAEVSMVAETFHYYAGAVDKHLGDTVPVAGGVDLTFHEPLGVVAAIVPWNFPLLITAWKVAPALACGNTVLVKPAELTPLTALRLAELALDAGLPEGVLSVVPGPGATVGAQLVAHPEVAKISFTGSTEVGRSVLRAAATDMKRVTLELGGKSASIVFADADLERAATASPSAVFGNAGQDCCARSRILVQQEVFDRFVARFVAATADVVVGDPEATDAEMGPLVSAAHRDRVMSFLDDTLEVAHRGVAPNGPGFWCPPVVLAPVRPDARVAREEVFGPVACVIPFRDEADAVALANASPYGLSGSVWTRDGAKALRVARAVESGTLSVNSNTSVRVSTPFGGFKHSGIGRELGMAALANYSEIKNVFIDTTG